MPARLVSASTIRVAAVPGCHPYTRALLDPESDAVELLADPPARDGADDRWWPPSMLTAEWIGAHAADFDVMHVHFGMESSTLDQLDAVLNELADSGKPLVYTVHDLQNPQLADQRHHDAQLDLLIPRADALTTLTAGAGREIEQRWGRRPHLVRHPHVAPLEGEPESGSALEGTDILVSLRDLRPNIDGIGTVRALAAALDALPRASARPTVVVDVNESVRDAAQLRAIEDAVAATSGRLRLRRHPRYEDSQLAKSIASARVAVLPYRFGTHSGWAELCWDLGVPVIAPPVGYLAEQHEDTTVADFAHPEALAEAVTSSLLLATAPESTERMLRVHERRAARMRERSIIAGRHARIYGDLLS